MAMRDGFKSRNNHAVGVIASFLIILEAAAASIVIIAAGFTDVTVAVCVVLAVFGVIAFIPLLALRPDKASYERTGKRLGFSAWLKQSFARRSKSGSSKAHETWKRKPTSFESKPFGAEYVESIFTPTRGREDSSDHR